MTFTGADVFRRGEYDHRHRPGILVPHRHLPGGRRFWQWIVYGESVTLSGVGNEVKKMESGCVRLIDGRQTDHGTTRLPGLDCRSGR
jgi:hypothetical protein